MTHFIQIQMKEFNFKKKVYSFELKSRQLFLFLSTKCVLTMKIKNQNKRISSACRKLYTLAVSFQSLRSYSSNYIIYNRVELNDFFVFIIWQI